MRNFMHSGRRAFLRGLGGAAIALPLLEYTHGRALAGGAMPKRFLTVFSHGGEISSTSHTNGRRFGPGGESNWQDLWSPASPAESLALGPIHQPLTPFTSKLLVLQGIDNRAAIEQGGADPGGGHGKSNVTALTASDIREDGEDWVALGPSIDEVLAQRLATTQPARFSRIHLGVRGHQYGTPYHRASGEKAWPEEDPRIAFARIFEGVTSDETAPDPALVQRRTMRRSILDGLTEGYDRMRTRVSAIDLHAVDAHLTHLRALERELEMLDMPAMCLPPSEPGEEDTAPGDVVGPLHVQIMIAAIRCGLTNVANLEIADILTPWTAAGVRVESAFDIGHSLHHYGSEVGPDGASAGIYDDWLAEMLDNRRWRMSLVAQLLAGLDDPTFLEGDRTLLDNSLLLYTSEFSNGAWHSAWNAPVLLAGSAGGVLRTGRHIDYDRARAADPGTVEHDSDQSLHNLFTAILQAFGGDDAHFGSDHAVVRGPIPGLT
jgi:hypothetical protein